MRQKFQTAMFLQKAGSYMPVSEEELGHFQNDMDSMKLMMEVNYERLAQL
jgi:hypothetical protein